MSFPQRRSYNVKRVQGLLEDWEQMLEAKGVYGHALDILVEMIDLRRGITRLNRGEREVCLVCGIAGVTIRGAVPILGASDHMVVFRRYSKALEKLTTYMNGAR